MPSRSSSRSRSTRCRHRHRRHPLPPARHLTRRADAIPGREGASEDHARIAPARPLAPARPAEPTTRLEQTASPASAGGSRTDRRRFARRTAGGGAPPLRRRGRRAGDLRPGARRAPRPRRLPHRRARSRGALVARRRRRRNVRLVERPGRDRRHGGLHARRRHGGRLRAAPSPGPLRSARLRNRALRPADRHRLRDLLAGDRCPPRSRRRAAPLSSPWSWGGFSSCRGVLAPVRH